MKFNIPVYQLEHYLLKAATALGSGQSTSSTQGFCFSFSGEHLIIWCTDKNSFAEVETTIPVKEDAEDYALNASRLLSLMAYLNPQDDVSFELLDSHKVKIVSGSYEGEWVVIEKENFPSCPEKCGMINPPVPINIHDFCKSIEVVRYAAEGILGIKRRIVFRRGLCWAASVVRFQSVESKLDESLDIVIPFAALNAVKFLEKSKQTDEDEFAYAESETYRFFYTNRDVFSCLKAVDPEEKGKAKQKEEVEPDEDEDFRQRLTPEKYLWFEIEVGDLHNAITRASLTCEPKSAEIQFEFDEKMLYVVGADAFENQGIDKLIVSPQGDMKQLGGVKVAGWMWVLAALHAVKAKAVRVTFDDNFLIISNETSKGILALVSRQNVKRLTAAK